jgi:predicted HAD superfamily Cof-like phosphohydrolase
MTNPFYDQTKFMNACDQTTDIFNSSQYELYCNLIAEEFTELQDAKNENSKVDQLDALIDILVVTIGAINSLGANGEAAWNEVMKTNFAKIDTTTGKVRKREDGKVLKPDNWQPPNLTEYV